MISNKTIFNHIIERLDKAGNVPSILDYYLANWDEINIDTYEVSCIGELTRGCSEGIYIDLYLRGWDGVKDIYYRLGTIKTLEESREAWTIMAKLMADFQWECGEFISEHLDDLTSEEVIETFEKSVQETRTVTTEVVAAPVEAEATCTCGGSEDHANRIIINTPCGLRYIDVPDYQGETLWEAVAKYDAANGTDLEERLEIEDIVAAGQESTAYSCSPLSFPEDFGEPVTEWEFDDCKVSEEEFDHDLHCFVVEMERDGQIRRQTVYPRDLDDMDALRRHLIGGRSPIKSGWEDGMGNDVCWENAKGDAPAYSFVQFNGNCGSEQGFETLKEAEDAAEYKWDHLTDREKAAYSEPGCYFMVIEGEISEGGDIGTIIRDFTEEERITEWTGTKKIGLSGTSLTVAITEACRILGLERGDIVEVTIRRKD